jgi:ABC-type uncharacterized transport system auxiliary subunit
VSARRAIPAVVAALAATACLSRPAPERARFVLDAAGATPPVAARDGAAASGTVEVERVRVAPAFEREPFVYRTGEAAYESDYYNGFFAPPGLLLRETLQQRLEAAALFEHVLGTRRRAAADFLLETRVEELYSDLRDRSRPRAIVAIEFALLDARSPRLDVAFQKRYAAEEPIANLTGAGVAAGINAALARILGELEADLAALPSAPRE